MDLQKMRRAMYGNIFTQLQAVNVDTIVGIIMDVIGDVRDPNSSWSDDTELGSVTTAGDLRKVRPGDEPKEMLEDILGAAIGRVTHMIVRHNGFDPAAMPPAIIVHMMELTNPLHAPVLAKVQQLLSNVTINE